MRRWLGLLGVAFLTLWGMAGCDEEYRRGLLCAEGAALACECEDGARGWRVCEAGGQEFGACVCGGASPEDAGEDLTTDVGDDAEPDAEPDVPVERWPKLEAPTELLFGELEVGQRASRRLDLYNVGSAPLHIGSLLVAGDDSFTLCDLGRGVCATAEAELEGATLDPGEVWSLEVWFGPDLASNLRGLIEVRSDDPAGPHTVWLTGDGVIVRRCAVAVASGALQGDAGQRGDSLMARPLDTLFLDASGSYDPESPDGQLGWVEWAVVQRPDGSTSRLEPSEGAASPSLFLDLVGTYRVELRVFDAQGEPGCAPARVVVRVVPDQDVHIQLVWDTPADNDQTDQVGSDLDLHLLHPRGLWNDDLWDCHYRTPAPDWGRQGDPSDDPSLDIDDTDGAGPENINLDSPQALRYRVGVHAFGDNGLGDSVATVRVFLGGTLAFEDTQELRNQFFWEPAVVDWSRLEVLLVDRVSSGFPP